MKKYVNFLIPLAIFVLVVWAGKGLFKYSFYQTHDIKRHLVRGYDAVLTIREGHFPLRWAGLTNYECGVPTFNFYYPLLYYLVIVINRLVGGIMLPLKIVSFLSLAVGTWFFYLWMKEETENKWGSFVSAILYLYAPYRFSLIYVRGSPEYLSYAILPVVFYFFARTFKAKGNFQFFVNAFWAAIFGGILTVSHNIVSLFIMPIILIYLVVKLLQNKKLGATKVVTIIFSYLSAFGLGAFFIFPAIFEERFTQIATPIFNYYDHFPALWQLISSKWGYGDSAIGTALDGMSFQLGYAQWLVVGLTSFWLIYALFKAKLSSRNILIPIFLMLSLLFIFLILPWSLPLWQRIKILQTVDFPWRLLGIAVFTISALFGFWISTVKVKKLYWILIIGVAVLAFTGERNHLLAQPVLESELPFYKGLDSLSVRRRSVPAFADNILPPSAEISCYLTTPVASSNDKKDQIIFEEVKRGSILGTINFTVSKGKLRGDRVVFNLGYFPDMYRFYLNGVRYDYLDCKGLVCVKATDLKEGTNQVSWKVGQTKIQRLFNLVTLIFFGAWICILTYAALRYQKK